MTLIEFSRKFRTRLSTVKFFVRLLAMPNQRAYAWRWLRSREKDYLLKRASPWIVFSAIDFLDKQLQLVPNARVFEYGSGGSTLYWLKKGAMCVSVEHDADWYQLVREKVAEERHVDLRLVKADSGTLDGLDPANPHHYASADRDYRDRQFRQYVQQIDAFPDETFDFILIDGRARPSCLAHSLTKVRVGGYIILDNNDRKYYTTQVDLSGFSEHHFDGALPCNTDLIRTTIYQRNTTAT